MNGIHGAVAVAYLYVLPALLGVLGVTAGRRDRFAARVLLAVCAGFVLVSGLEAFGASLSGPAAPVPPGFAWLWPAAALGLAIRLHRDRRAGHVRSRAESLAVLASGAILLATLLSLPVLLAPPDNAGPV